MQLILRCRLLIQVFNVTSYFRGRFKEEARNRVPELFGLANAADSNEIKSLVSIALRDGNFKFCRYDQPVRATLCTRGL